MVITIEFLSAEVIREAAGRVASSVLPDELAETLPVVTRTDEGVRAIVLFYRVSGPPGRGRPGLPSHVMLLEPRTGEVIRFLPMAPDDQHRYVGLAPMPGVRPDMSDMHGFLARRRRFLALSAGVWEAFEQRSPSRDAAIRPEVQEYYGIFEMITPEAVAPYYVTAAKDFFDWVRGLAGVVAG